MIYNVIQPTAAKFEWGDETAIGDAEWWAGLKAWITGGASASDRSACVGKKKLVSLSTSVLGANAATMVCIGADQDGTGTLTFQTAGTLPTTTTFGTSAVWIGSTARTECKNFYNYCSAKASIKTVRKGTCANPNDSRNGTPVYNDETVWLPSEREMGLNSYAPISTANSTTAKAECTYGYNANYNYYTSNALRIKYLMNADGSLASTNYYYWERSRFYNSSAGKRDYVCRVGSDGSAVSSDYYASRGLAPAFVIG